MVRGSSAIQSLRQALSQPSPTASRAFSSSSSSSSSLCSTCATLASSSAFTSLPRRHTVTRIYSPSYPHSSIHTSSRVAASSSRPPPPTQERRPSSLPARTTQPSSDESSGRPSSDSDNNDASDDSYDSLYSSRYRGQGAKSSVPPWYKSPPLILLGIMPLFTLGLGVWQIQRLDWKLGLIEELEYKLTREPIRLPKNINLAVLPEFEFRLVDVTGHFDHTRAMFVGPRVRDGAMGYHVVVPFLRSGGGGAVLVDRGFVADRLIIKEDIVTPQGERVQVRRLRWEDEAVAPKGTVTLTALLPRLSGPNMFQPKNEPQRGLWFWPDPQAMAEWASSPRAVTAADADADADADSYTLSAGVRSSVKEMLGLSPTISSSSSDEAPPVVLPVYLEEIFNGYDGSYRAERGIPVGRAATIELRNQHAVYAATWFSLSAATAAMFAILVRSRRAKGGAGGAGAAGAAMRMGRRVRREL